MESPSTAPVLAPEPPPALERSVPLERKLPLLVLGLFTVVLAISISFSYYQVKRSALELAGDRLAGLAQALGSIVEQQANARLALLRRVARDSAIVSALRAPDRAPPAAVAKALAPLIATPADTATPPEVWTAGGHPIGRRRLEPVVDQRRFRDELARLAASRDSGYVSPLRISGGRASYFNVVPVRAGDGALLGFVVQERKLNTNPRALQPLRGLIGSDIEFYLRNAGDNTWVQLAGGAIPPPTRTERTLDSLNIFTHGAAGRLLAATARAKGTPLLITVERPMSAILARAMATTRVLLAIGVILALVGAIVVWVLSRRIVRPLGELTRAAEAIAHGRYGQRVAVGGSDEIGRLGAAFNRMAEEVKASSDTSTRALTRLTRSMETQEFLAETSRILAGSVSDETMLTDLARYCVPKLADYCSIHVADDDGSIRRIETAHRDPAKLAPVRALQQSYQYRIDGPGEVALVIRTQKPLIIPQLDMASILKAAPDEETARLLEVVGPTSFMCVPLLARGRAFGAMSFTMAGSGRVFWPEDVEIAMELARRTAVAIDNAVIYRRSLALRLEAEAASNAKSDFLAKMSHEIRTPINAMMGYAELLQMGISGPVSEIQSKQLERIRSSGDHLTSLVNEILDLAKIEAGHMGLQSTVGVAGDAAEAALAVVRPHATTKGVDLAPTVEGRPGVEYFGDPQRVHQILTNLLSNAVKYTTPGGRVSVRADLGKRPDIASSDGSSDWACVSVSDTGVGIEAGDLERIFHPFVQVETGYTRAQGGTGLGLTISRNLARMMGGEITVESVLGQGSRFTVWLPCPNRALATA